MALTQVKTTGIADDAVTEDKVANDAIGIAEMKAGTDGQIITYNASGNPTTVGPGTDGQVLTSTGAGSPPAFETLNTTPEGTAILSTGESGGSKFLREDGDGSCSWQTLPASGAALTGSTDNTIVTVTGSNAIQGEAKLTFDGSIFSAKNTSSNAGVDFNVSSNTNPRIDFNTASVGSSGIIKSEESGSGAIMEFHNKNSSGNEQQVITLTVDRNLQINDGNLVLASGHGIDFSATGNGGATMQNELLEDYEEGTFTPTLRGNNNNSSPEIQGNGKYTKVGRLVHVWISFQNKDESYLPSGEYIQIHGLPYTIGGGTQVAPHGMNYKIGFSTNYQYYWYLPINNTKIWGYYNVNAAAYQAWGTDQWRVAGNIYHENSFTYMID